MTARSWPNLSLFPDQQCSEPVPPDRVRRVVMPLGRVIAPLLENLQTTLDRPELTTMIFWQTGTARSCSTLSHVSESIEADSVNHPRELQRFDT